MSAHLLLFLILGGGVALMLIRPRGIAEVWWISGTTALLLLLGLLPLREAAAAAARGTDVCLFLFGMMLLAELARRHGVFDWISTWAARAAGGSAARLFTLVYVIGTAVTVLMSNDATAVVLTPAVLGVVRKARVHPLPALFACALVANAASFVLPISNPANLAVFQSQGGMPPLGRWLLAFALPSVLAIAVTYLVLRVAFRAELAAKEPAGTERRGEAGNKLRTEARWVLVGLGLTVAVLLTASALGEPLGLPAALAVTTLAAAVSARARSNPVRLLRGISWGTLILVEGLFVMVAAATAAGALQPVRSGLLAAEKLGPAAGVLLTGFAVGIGNNLVNNLPLGLLAGAALRQASVHRLLADAVLIAVDLGPNLSVTGSLATILWLQALHRGGVRVSASQFLRVGAVAMPLALLAALGGLLLEARLRASL